ncbi:germ cell nuclear acidic protein [Vespula squamosa]|uniref:Germ cell nuclear acidic protein n=1 Tax=Vespula squamosa TaxID=30214 RepID=A0ABD2B2Q3_VESSQ
MSDFSEDSFSLSADKQKYRKGYQILPEVSNRIDKTTKDILKVPIIGSQDFSLKLSDNSVIEDTQDILPDNNEINTNKDDIIVISDSSIDCSLDYFSKKKITTPVIPKDTYRSLIRSKNYALEISDDSNEDENFYEKWRNVSVRNKRYNKFSNCINITTLQDKNSFYTSDDSSKNSSTSSSEPKTNINVSENRYISSTLINTKHNDEKSRQIQDTSEKEENVHTPVSNLNLLNKLTNYNINSNNSNTNNSKKSKTCIQLTKGDLNKILTNIQSTKASYESPKLQNVVIDETLDNEVHPALLSDDSLIKRIDKPPATIIDETPSNSDIIRSQCTEINIVTSSKIYDQSVEIPIDNQVKGLSERKKKEIADWLMLSSPRSYSDSSFTNVPASSKNSISSGNSSLERLEMDYETPNNRGKMKFKTNENDVIVSDANKKTSPMVWKPKTPHKFLHKPDDSVPKSSNILQKKKSDQCKNVDTKQSNNLNVMECTDILDKLYGNIWRDKASALLSTPTEKQQIVMRKDRAVQTERKATRNEHYSIKAGDKQNKFNTDKKVRLINKKQTKYTTQKNSFINDSSSSENECESLYYTALTNPQTSNIVSDKLNTVSSSVQRAIQICDSDEEDEYNTNCHPTIERVLDRKRLSFSNEEDSSDTSEFDPGDDITQKRVYKKDIYRTKKNSRTTTTTANKNLLSSIESKKKETHKSFLASLSDSIPLISVHPNAKKYRLSYKNNKEELCKYLYKLYNENIFDKKLPEDMKIEWNIRMRGTAGYCYNKKSVKPLGGILRSSRIVLSTKVLDTPDRLRDTLIHEMCHAAAWLINDVSDGHGPFWTAWANKALRAFPELPPIRRCHDYKIKTKFTYRCIECGYSIGRHSKSLDIEKKRCGHCYGKFELLINKTTKSGTVQMQTPKREPSAFALYVKENYNSVKKDKKLKHAEVMKLLGQQFSAIKIAKKDDNNVDNNKDSSD